MLAIAPVHPSKKAVVVADWDSEEEGKRSARGIEFRRRLKEDSQEKKRADQQARHAADLDLAERVYEALILATNQGPLDTLARDPNTLFFEYFEGFYRDLVASTLGHNVPNRNNRGGTSVMLNRISRSNITSQQIQQHNRLVSRLVTIGSIPDFRDRFLVRREGHVSSEEDDVGAAQAPAQAPARAGRRRRREEEDQQAAARRVLRRGG